MIHSRLLPLNQQATLRPTLVAVLLLTQLGQSSGSDDVEARLREIREAWFTVAERPEPFRTKYTERLYRAEAGKALELASETIAGRVMSADGIAFDKRVYTYKLGERKFGQHEVHLINDRYSCVLIDKSDSNQFILSGQPALYDQKPAQAWSRDTRLYGRLPWLAPSATFKIPDLLDPEFTQVSKFEELGDGGVRVSFQTRPDLTAEEKERLRGVMGGTLVLNRNKHYRLESAEIQLNQQAFTISYRLTYEGPPHEDYLLKGLEQQSKWLRNEVPMSGKQVWEYECRHNIEVDPRQFYMSYYGLPEPVGVTPPAKLTPRYVWLLAGAAIFAALALLFRWGAKRRSRSESSTPAPTA